jgi:branched-chain amino acid transport system permease protein
MSLDVLYVGLFTGAVYALVALGLTIIYKPTHILNFAQGQAAILGAIVVFQVTTLWGWGWWAALALLVAAAVIMGGLTERLTTIPANRSRSHYGWIIASFAVTMVFEAIFSLTYINVPSLSADPIIPGRVTIFGGHVSWQALLTIGVAVLLTAGYAFLLRSTRQGMAIRAMSHSQPASVLMGIPVNRIVVISFAAGACVTALAGFLAAPELFILPTAGLLFTIMGFIASVIGGLGSPIGALTGGMLVGLLDTVVRTQINGSAGNFAVFGIMAVVLVLFPRGLFREVDAVRA